MLKAVSQPELDVREIENLVKSESLVVLPSAALLELRCLRIRQRDPSPPHALAILGEREVRRWIRSEADTLGAGQNKSNDLVLSALVLRPLL